MSSLPIGIAANVQSAYYPSGWDRERLIGASQEDLLSIPPDVSPLAPFMAASSSLIATTGIPAPTRRHDGSYGC